MEKTITGDLKVDARMFPDGGHLYVENANGRFIADITYRVNPMHAMESQKMLLSVLVQMFEKADAQRARNVAEAVHAALPANGAN
jgi:hypothetical protein